MRSLVLVMLLTACGDDGGHTACTYNGTSFQLGAVFPAGDGCNACTCTEMGVNCSGAACPDAGVDANPASCAASGGCPSGPACGTVCCGIGEKCVGGVCKCGTASGCDPGDGCAAAGPIGPDTCGTICCGVSGPCPQ